MDRKMLPDIWRELLAATRTRSAFTLMQLATVGTDNTPELRTIVVRGVDIEHGSLLFVTDLRSPKVMQIRANPLVCLAAYDSGRNVQLRIDGEAAVVEDASQRREIWTSMRLHTQIRFRTPYAPGTILNAPGDVEWNSGGRENLGAPDDHYGLVRISVTSLEWLDLSVEPHRRIRFRRVGTDWRSEWLAP